MKDLHCYKYFVDYIYKNTGIFYEPKNDHYRIEERLKQLCSKYDQPNFDELMNFYKMSTTPDMHTYVIDLFTNNETYFFRDEKAFISFIEHIFTPFIEKYGYNSTFHVWINACSSGQEIYSLLMSIKDAYPEYPLSNIRIQASDINSDVLKKAKTGTYTPQDIQRGLPIHKVIKYFTQNADDTWTIHDEFKNCVKFIKFNIVKDYYPLNMYDAIFCRNVLIYLQKEDKTKVLKNLLASLKIDGHLLLGTGESLIGLNISSQTVKLGNSVYYKK
jgi:chemotaxis protein methyltransferase CheR